jgi:hypothetical protein
MISSDISCPDFIRRCRDVKCTVNEAIISLIGVTLKEYAIRHGDNKLDAIMIASTFVLKPFPERVEDIPYGNNWVLQAYKIPV